MSKLVLILGATGMLGHKLCQLLPTMNFQVTATCRQIPEASLFDKVKLLELADIQNLDQLENIIAEHKPDVVINCIGIVKQLAEADDRYISVAINSFLPHQLQRLCFNHGAKFIHISTDCVFNGSKGMYLESDPSDALDIYGKSKYLGETDESQTNALTLRTSIIGHELKQNTHGLLGWFFNQKGREVQGFQHAYFSGFTTNELARVIAYILNNHPQLHGLYHLASQRINKYDLLCLVNDIYQLNIKIKPETEFVCDRSLDMSRFIQTTGYRPPDWESMIKTMYTEEN